VTRQTSRLWGLTADVLIHRSGRNVRREHPTGGGHGIARASRAVHQLDLMLPRISGDSLLDLHVSWWVFGQRRPVPRAGAHPERAVSSLAVVEDLEVSEGRVRELDPRAPSLAIRGARFACVLRTTR
jgi:hypothetical protein